jgi:hypothetical protein
MRPGQARIGPTMRRLPLPLKLYAVLAFISALEALWRGTELFIDHAGVWRIAFELLWAAFEIVLAIGILRLHPAARIAALICCWFTFVLFGLILACWCVWPQSVSVAVVIVVAAAAVLNFYFYAVFRRPDIRALFRETSARPL